MTDNEAVVGTGEDTNTPAKEASTKHYTITPPPHLCRSQCHLARHPPTAVVIILFVVFVAISPPPAYSWLLCAGQTGSDIVDFVITS